ncbi:amidohydrolase [Simiduia aestuariiviva]|uniref:Amidohydrolase 3 domain-containing protein n=1 Tax=Simiduia aestuariiviva TaxID=1510459 RepID=A0A839UJX8_9GAMM|nr:amidohydrolase family protein [Simiduia aestuariiviva]MBB3167903.1 hypothetical protein [Simiduia aestuariiviva]
MRAIVWFILGLNATLFISSAQSDTHPADLIITNGSLFVSGEVHPTHDSIAIHNGIIVGVFENKDIQQYTSAMTRIIDVESKLVIPGIIDAHHHSIMSPGNIKRLSFDTLNPTKHQVATAIKDAVAKTAKGTWLYVSIGGRVIDDASINAAFLDALAPQHPVWLATYYGHGDVMNSLAMNGLNIGALPEANDGGFYEQDTKGALTGRLYEYAHWVPKATMVNQLSDEVIIDQLKTQAERAIKFGITSWHDMPMLKFDRYLQLLEQAKLPVRVTAIPMPHISVAKNTYLPSAKTINPKIIVQGEKWILDGTPIERGAALSVDYLDQPNWRGRINFSADYIGKLLDGVIERNSQPLFHISGDRTLATLLTEMEKRDVNWPDYRVRIEHGDGFNAALLQRAKKQGIIVVQNPSHFMNKAIGTQRLPKNHPFMYFKTLIDHNIALAIGSDGPMNPYLNMMFARIHAARPEEGIDVASALQLYTSGSAYAGKQEAQLGQIKTGMQADLAVLSQNILEVPLEELPNTTSVLTIVNGEIAYVDDDKLN